MRKKNCRFTAMNQRPFYIVVWAIAIILISSCSKGGSGTDDGSGGGPHVVITTDSTAPVILIFTPTANQVFTSGNTINISGRLTDDLGLYRGTIQVTNDANGMILMNQAYEIHGQLLYNFNINHTASVTTSSDYTVTVAFEDHGLNFTTRTVKVKVNP
jgi:hypothetical protein